MDNASIFAGALDTVCKEIANKKQLKVVWVDGKNVVPSYNPATKVITLPAVGTVGRDDDDLRTFAYHESGHARYTGKTPDIKDNRQFQILNAIEDVRMERCVKLEFMGTSAIFAKTDKRFYKECFLDSFKDALEAGAPLWQLKAMTGIFYAKGFDISLSGDLMDDFDKKTFLDGTRGTFSKACKAAETLFKKWSEEEAKLEEEKKNQLEQSNQNPDDSEEQEDEEQQAPGNPDSEEKEEEQAGNGGLGNDDEEEEREDEESGDGLGEGEEDESEEDDEEHAGNSGSSDDDEDVEDDGSTSESTSGDGDSPEGHESEGLAPDEDANATDGNGDSTPNGQAGHGGDSQPPDFLKSKGDFLKDEIMEKIQEELGRIAGDNNDPVYRADTYDTKSEKATCALWSMNKGAPLSIKNAQLLTAVRNSILAKLRARTTRHLKAGSIDSTLIDRIYTTDRVFSKRTEQKTPKTAVSLVIDGSGSMSGSKLTNSLATAKAIGDCLRTLNINYEIVVQWDKNKDEGYGRNKLESHLTFFKEFSKARVPENVYDGLARNHFGICTSNFANSEAIFLASQRLMKLNAHRKVIFMITDGCAELGWLGENALIAGVKERITEAHRRNQEVYAIGMTNNPGRFNSVYESCDGKVTINPYNPEQIAESILPLFKDCLLKNTITR